jgi:hypothetical protein
MRVRSDERSGGERVGVGLWGGREMREWRRERGRERRAQAGALAVPSRRGRGLDRTLKEAVLSR